MATPPVSPATRDVTPGGERIEPKTVSPRQLALVAVVVVLSLQSFRILFPLAYNYGERTSFVSAGVLALALFMAPAVVPAIRALLSTRASLVLAVAGLGAARLTVQLWRPVPLWLGGTMAVLALVALTLVLVALRSRGGAGGRRFVIGLLLGLAADAAILALSVTWEPAWRDGAGAMATALVLAAVAVAATWAEPPRTGPPVANGPGVWSTAALGPFLMLHVLFLQNVAFTASATGFHLPGASALVLGGDLLAVWALLWTAGRPVPLAARAGVGAALVILAALLNETSGIGAALVFLGSHVPAAVLLSEALGRRGPAGAWRIGVGMAVASLGFLLLTLLFYLHYEMPLPFPNVALAPIAAALLAAAGLRAAPADADGVARWPAAAVAVILLVPVVLALVFPVPPTAGRAGSIRVVNYNVHTAVDVQGQLDPEAIAGVIEAQRPDVVTLQEVSRGWAVSGSADVGEWLSQRLDMPYVYAPAADRGFGNAILSRFPMVESDWGYLPKGTGPMDRSWIRAVLDLGAGRRLTVIGTHLHHQHDAPDDNRTRLDQIGELLKVWGGVNRAVIAGDMNAEPTTDEIARFEAAGLRAAGDLSIPTYPSTAPRDRIDYIFGTGDLGLSDVVISRSTASDHLAVAATVSLG
jgi:endonuclease/exonuclease/phosphatase family metal-dependent hydrolase